MADSAMERTRPGVTTRIKRLKEYAFAIRELDLLMLYLESSVTRTNYVWKTSNYT